MPKKSRTAVRAKRKTWEIVVLFVGFLLLLGVRMLAPNWFNDLAEFIKEWILQWINIFGAVSLAWVLFETFSGKKVLVKTAIAIAGTCLFFAAFGAWREQYEKAKPVSLRAFVVPGASSVVTGETQDGSAMLLLLLTVVNAGRPTTIHGYLLDIMEGQKRVYEVGPQYLSKNTTFKMYNGAIRQIKESEMIYNKVLSPIIEGGQVSGFVYYILKGFSRDELFKNDRSFKVSFWDAAGKEYNVEVKNLHQEFQQGIIPGVDNPFVPDATQPSPTLDTEASPHSPIL